MAQGALQAGITTEIAIEKDPVVAQTYLKNHPNTTIVVDSIENIKEFSLSNIADEIVLFGGPPCQGYSYSNRKTRNILNPMNWLFKEFIRAALFIRPDWIVLENVPGLKKMGNGFFLKEILNDLKQLGYTPSCKIVNAVDYGVPQKRERLIIVASKHGIVYNFPEGLFAETPVTVWDAISDLPALDNGAKESLLKYNNSVPSDYAKNLRQNRTYVTQNYVTKHSNVVIERYKRIAQGHNWTDIPNNLMSNYKNPSMCHSGIYRRLKSDEPSFIIANYRKSMMIHPFENRGLSVREAARLQSFPDNFEFIGNLDQIQQQVGNAVPPLLAKAIFNKLLEYS